MEEVIEEEVVAKANIGEIDPFLLEQVEIIKQVFGLDSINSAIAYMIGVIDILANDDKLAGLTLLRSKRLKMQGAVDGVITPEEAQNLRDVGEGKEQAQETEEDEIGQLIDLMILMEKEKEGSITEEEILGLKGLVNQGGMVEEIIEDVEKGAVQLEEQMEGEEAPLPPLDDKEEEEVPKEKKVTIKTVSLNEEEDTPSKKETLEELITRKRKQFNI